jgi:hypothetical protein
MRRTAVLLATMATLASLMVVAAPPAHATDEGCGSNTVWSKRTAAGNLYEVKGTICNSDEGNQGRAVVHWYGYRNGAPWHNGYRFDGTLHLQTIATGCTTPCVDAVAPKYVCYTCGGPFVQHSGRLYGNFWNSPGAVMRAKTSGSRARVRYADGTTELVGLIELVGNPSTI